MDAKSFVDCVGEIGVTGDIGGDDEGTRFARGGDFLGESVE